MRTKYKIIAYVAAWIVALLVTDPDMKLFPLIYVFPLGLASVFHRQLANAGGWTVLIGSALVYVVHGWFYFRSKRASATWILYAVLIALLIVNVEGCRGMIHGH